MGHTGVLSVFRLCALSAFLTSAFLPAFTWASDDPEIDIIPSAILTGSERDSGEQLGFVCAPSGSDTADIALVGNPLFAQQTGQILRHNLETGEVEANLACPDLHENERFGTQLTKLGSDYAVTSAPGHDGGRGRILLMKTETLRNADAIASGDFLADTSLMSEVALSAGDGLGRRILALQSEGTHYFLAAAYDGSKVFLFKLDAGSETLKLKSTLTEAGGSKFGFALADLGDVDQDGRREIAIGSPSFHNDCGGALEQKGAISVYELSEESGSGELVLASTPEQTHCGLFSNFAYGSSVASFGEGMLAVGAPKASPGSEIQKPGALYFLKYQNGQYDYFLQELYFPHVELGQAPENQRYGTSISVIEKSGEAILQIGGPGNSEVIGGGQVAAVRFTENPEPEAPHFRVVGYQSAQELVGEESGSMVNMRFGQNTSVASQLVNGAASDEVFLSFAAQDGQGEDPDVELPFAVVNSYSTSADAIMAVGGSALPNDCGFDPYVPIGEPAVSVVSQNPGARFGSRQPVVGRPWQLWINPIKSDNIVPVVVAFYGSPDSKSTRFAPGSECYWELDVAEASQLGHHAVYYPPLDINETGGESQSGRAHYEFKFLGGSPIPETMLGEELKVQALVFYYYQITEDYMIPINYVELTDSFTVTVGNQG